MAALLQRHFVILSFGTALLFVLTMWLAASGSRVLLTSTTIQQATAGVSTMALVRVMSEEIPALEQSVQAPTEREAATVNSFLFQLATGVHPGDLRSILASELPGAAARGTDTALASPKGAADLYVESPAPGIAAGQDQAAAGGTASEQQSPAPAPTTGGKEVVFIYHTHNRESWLGVTDQVANSVNHPTKNITLVGKHLAEALNERGIGTGVNTDDIYQRLLDEGKSYPLSYAESLKVVKAVAQRDKDIRYFFDIHRDAQLPREKTTATINGKSYARILFVIGTRNKRYRENLKFAEELHALLQKRYPGLSRGVDDKDASEGNGEYNQSISPGSLLIEVGGVHNTVEECYNTAEAFADVFAEYYWQAERASASQAQSADKR